MAALMGADRGLVLPRKLNIQRRLIDRQQGGMVVGINIVKVEDGALLPPLKWKILLRHRSAPAVRSNRTWIRHRGTTTSQRLYTTTDTT